MIFDLAFSTIVFFAATWYLKRRFDDMDIPKGAARSLTVFALALVASYALTAAVDWFSCHVL